MSSQTGNHPSDAVKVGINIPIVSPAAETCIEINRLINKATSGAVIFGLEGNSSPHVTIAMGLIVRSDIKELVKLLEGLVSKLDHPIRMDFSKPYRETVTGRYVLADVILDESVQQWRRFVREQLLHIFAEPARTSEQPHLTLGLAETGQSTVDQALVRAPEIPSCTVSRIHVSMSGPKGIKSTVLAEVPIAGT